MKPKIKIRYKCKKVRLDRILNNKTDNLDKLQKYIYNAHYLSIQISHFIRTYVLYLYENNLDIPKIDSDLFLSCSNILSIKSGAGNPVKGDKEIFLKLLTKFYSDVYSKLGYKDKEKIPYLHLSQILSYIADEYETSVENNVGLNFINYIKRYVNASFISKFKKDSNYDNTNIIQQQIKEIELVHFNELLPIIENLVNKTNFLLKSKFYSNKILDLGKKKKVIKILSMDDKKLFKYLENIKNTYTIKYNNICKRLKIKKNLGEKINFQDVTIQSIKDDILIIDDINKNLILSTKELKIKSHSKRAKLDNDIKILRKELEKVKKDIIEDTNISDPKYSNFIDNFRKNILPDFDRSSYTLTEYIKDNPQIFIKSMISMVKILEEKGYKLFQFLPLYTTLIPRSIKLDTKILIEIFAENKKDYLDNIRLKQKEIWKSLFKIQNSSFYLSKSSSYVFDYSIVTNGYTASICFIHEEDKSKKNKGYDAKLNKRAINKDILKEFDSEEDSNKYKLEQEKIKADNKLKAEGIYRQKQKENKEKFKKLSKVEQDKILNDNKRENNDFLYIDDLNDKEIEEVRKKLYNYKIVVCDPGKKNLVYMRNDKGDVLKFTNREFLKMTKRLEYSDKLKKERDKLGITDLEKKLTDFCSKSVKLDTFCNYINKKNEIDKSLRDKYKNTKFRQYKWYSYINKERTEATFINRIKETFGEDITIFYGDWSIGKQMANFISTPNLRLKRKIAENLKVYNLDEYNTSKLSNVTFEASENLRLVDKFGIMRELHSVLTYYKKEIKGIECKTPIKCNINRDNNSSKNMMYIIKYYIKHKAFPKEFMREESQKILKVIETIHGIFNKLKDNNICIHKSSINELKNIVQENELLELLYLIKNATSNKRTLIPDNIIKGDEKFIETSKKILGELKNNNEKIILKFPKREELKSLFDDQKIWSNPKKKENKEKGQITEGLKGQLHERKEYS